MPSEISLSDCEDLVVLAFDQAIANTGWANIIRMPSGAYSIPATGTIKTAVSHDGHAGTLRRARKLYAQYKALLESFEPHLVVMELPPVGRAAMRPESALVAGAVLHVAVEETYPEIPIKIIGAQRAKKYLTGNGNASKQEMGRAVKDRLESLNLDPKKVGRMNEHVRDAIGLGITAIETEVKIIP